MYDITSLVPSDLKFCFCSGLFLVCHEKGDKTRCVVLKPWISADGFLTLIHEKQETTIDRLTKYYYKRCKL